MNDAQENKEVVLSLSNLKLKLLGLSRQTTIFSALWITKLIQLQNDEGVLPKSNQIMYSMY